MWLCKRLNNIATDRLTEYADFGKKKIISSDEAHFGLGGYVNKQNCRIWGTENPHAYIEKPIMFQRHNWAILLRKWARRGHYSQWRSLNEFLFTKTEEEDISNIWFQQDGATCHTAEATFDVLCPVLKNHIISRRADVVWPPRSCDLTPLVYYLWSHWWNTAAHNR